MRWGCHRTDFGGITMVDDSHCEVLFIQFAKAPRPGFVKTRLLPILNARAAAELHSELLLKTCHTLCKSALGAVELWVDHNAANLAFSDCLAMGIDQICLQQGDDLGQRMAAALANGLLRHQVVILVGSDCPDIDTDYLLQAVRALNTHDIVIGPAEDGGYVLIGLKQPSPLLFQGISWGSDQVYKQTLGVIAELGVSWHALPPLRDIDRPPDLDYYRKQRGD